MLRIFGLMVVVGAVFAVPGTAFATHGGTNCDYAWTDNNAAIGDETPVPPGSTPPGEPQVVVYAGPEGTTGKATTTAGVCVNTAPNASGVEGGTAEVGTGCPNGGWYAVVDGDNDNNVPQDPTGSSDGYRGLSNCETGTKSPCPPGNAGTGSNSGGCVGIGQPTAEPFLICSSNIDGPTWDNTTRDGCFIP